MTAGSGRLLGGWFAAAAMVLPLTCAGKADTLAPLLLKAVHPEYPKAAVVDDIEGWVDVEFTVAKDGTVRDVTVIEADPPHIFDRAAVRAVSRWIYQPAEENGVLVERRIREHIVFQP